MFLCWIVLFEIELFICMKIDLALNNLQGLIYHKSQTKKKTIKLIENSRYFALVSQNVMMKGTDFL